MRINAASVRCSRRRAPRRSITSCRLHPSQLDREGHALDAQLGAERFEIALVQEAEMVGAPRVMAGKVRVWPDGPGGDRGLTQPPAPNQDRHPAEIDEDRGGATGYRVGRDRRPEHLHVPIGRGSWVFADDVDVVELERGIAHRFASR